MATGRDAYERHTEWTLIAVPSDTPGTLCVTQKFNGVWALNFGKVQGDPQWFEQT